MWTMLSRLTFAVMLVLLATILVTGCRSGIGNTKVSITKGVLTTAVDAESKPTGGTLTIFASDTPKIFCSFKLTDVSPDTIIKAQWVYVGGEVQGHDNEVLDEINSDVRQEGGSYYLALYEDMPVGGWWKGDYKIVLYANDKEKLTLPFKVQ